MTKETKYLFEVRYSDSRQGDLRVVEVEATDEGDAFNQASEDYYFGRLISIDKWHEV